MQKLASLFIIVTLALAYSCKEDESDRFKFLTGTVWTPVSLLANGVDATGPGGLLEGFVGDAKFNEDGTGTFGTYTGEWMFAAAEEKLVITTTSLPISVTLTNSDSEPGWSTCSQMATDSPRRTSFARYCSTAWNGHPRYGWCAMTCSVWMTSPRVWKPA